MTSSSAFDKLRRILLLEREQHYNDRAVSGGMERFLRFWEKQARDEVGPAGERAVDQLMARLADYRVMGQDARRAAIEDAVRVLDAPPTQGAQEPRQADEQSAREASPTRPEPANPRLRARESAERPDDGNGDGNRGGLTAPVTELKGVGPRNAERLARLGITTIRDLIYHFPHRYDDFAGLKKINQLAFDDEVTVVGVVREGQVRTVGRRKVFSATISDGTGVIECTWFNQPYLQRQLKQGREIAVSGKVGEFRGRLVFTNPQWEPLRRTLLHTGRLVPIYPLTEGLSMRWVRQLIRNTLKEWVPRIVDPLPERIIASASLVDLGSAIIQIHFPKSHEMAARARERLCFDELLLLQLGILRRRRAWRQERGYAIEVDDSLIDEFADTLPYAFTAAQERSIREILDDLGRPVPMSRLLQGDVGSGKTVVAVAGMLAAVRAGFQAALMAPTSVLAEQHHLTLTEMLAPFPKVRTALLVGSLSNAEKDAIRQRLQRGELDIVVGTHALIQDTVEFERLAFVVVDEQHRFGVRQRETLRDKGTGARPHMLAMSATPIPRTLALTVYGDLDVSVLDELPPHRQEVITAVRTSVSRERIYSFMRSQIEQGHQAFVICPLVEESDQIDAKAAVEHHRHLSNEIFPQCRVGLLHGRVGAEEKERVMSAFKAGEYDILVSTAVVEVGIDVPNATMMLIEGAERFGLAQLHQFRGRVGRGSSRSYCVLMSSTDSSEHLERLRIMEETSDGFVLAEKDLQMRGPGEFLGVRQHGLPELKVARLSDTAVLHKARREALALCESDPELEEPDHRALAHSVEHFWSSIVRS